MAGLAALPNEILSSIVSYSYNPTLIALCTTSSRLRAVAEEKLYSNISFNLSYERRPPPIEELLHTFFDNPSLGRSVRSFKLTGVKRRRTEQGGSPYTCTETHTRMVPAVSIWSESRHKEYRNDLRAGPFAQELGLNGQKFYFRGYDVEDHCVSFTGTEAYERGEADVIVAMLIALMPRLEDLYISTEFFIDTSYLSNFISSLHSLDQTKELVTSLRHIDIGRGLPHLKLQGNPCYFQDLIYSALKLPNVESVDTIMPFLDPLFFKERRRPFDNLKSLTLRFYRALGGAGVLRQLFELTPNLTHLDLCPSIDPPEEPYLSASLRSNATFKDIVRALEPLVGTLEVLRLWAGMTKFVPLRWGGQNDKWRRVQQMLGSGSYDTLKKFSQLRFLEIPFFVVFDQDPVVGCRLYDLIPPGLGELRFNFSLALPTTLHRVHSTIKQFVIDLRNNGRSRLKNIVIVLDHVSQVWRPEGITHPREYCAAAGIEFELFATYLGNTATHPFRQRYEDLDYGMILPANTGQQFKEINYAIGGVI